MHRMNEILITSVDGRYGLVCEIGPNLLTDGEIHCKPRFFIYRTESKEDIREGIRDSKEYIEVGKQVQDPR